MDVSISGNYPQNTPKWSFLVGKPMVVGYHYFRKPPKTSCASDEPQGGTKLSAAKWARLRSSPNTDYLAATMNRVWPLLTWQDKFAILMPFLYLPIRAMSGHWSKSAKISIILKLPFNIQWQHIWPEEFSPLPRCQMQDTTLWTKDAMSWFVRQGQVKDTQVPGAAINLNPLHLVVDGSFK